MMWGVAMVCASSSRRSRNRSGLRKPRRRGDRYWHTLPDTRVPRPIAYLPGRSTGGDLNGACRHFPGQICPLQRVGETRIHLHGRMLKLQGGNAGFLSRAGGLDVSCALPHPISALSLFVVSVSRLWAAYLAEDPSDSMRCA